MLILQSVLCHEDIVLVVHRQRFLADLLAGKSDKWLAAVVWHWGFGHYYVSVNAVAKLSG